MHAGPDPRKINQHCDRPGFGGQTRPVIRRGEERAGGVELVGAEVERSDAV